MSSETSFCETHMSLTGFPNHYMRVKVKFKIRKSECHCEITVLARLHVTETSSTVVSITKENKKERMKDKKNTNEKHAEKATVYT